ncbi:general transcription factor II-I repeat domain-containing protein 2-like [Nothobranchius furzeri]|uniref:general transcription factor II-I repeat domain-containing protein 2-like n=1 Tax=Nothobranchius furzeri TaxID=105023 RepID=UPI003904D998
MNHRQFVALLEEHETEHSDIGYHTAVRWLSLGKVLKRVWDLKAEIREFCERKGKDIPELSDEDWLADFAFAVDVTALMNELNTKLQGKGLFVHEMHSLVKAFMRKLQFLSSQLESNTLTDMQTLNEVTPSADHLSRHSSMLGALHGEFSRRFEDLRTIEDEMHMISSPFTCSVDNAPSDVQLELIDLQSDAVLAEHLKSGSLLDFYSSLGRTFNVGSFINCNTSFVVYRLECPCGCFYIGRTKRKLKDLQNTNKQSDLQVSLIGLLYKEVRRPTVTQPPSQPSTSSREAPQSRSDSITQHP